MLDRARNLLEETGDMIVLTGKTVLAALRPPYPYGGELVSQFLFDVLAIVAGLGGGLIANAFNGGATGQFLATPLSRSAMCGYAVPACSRAASTARCAASCPTNGINAQ